MAQSIRVSDELYHLAQQAASKMERSLAQQIEYWARLGLALDAQGVTSTQAMRLVAGEPIAQYVVSASAAPADGAPEVTARKATMEQAVRDGRRAAESLFLFSRKQARAAKLEFPPEPDDPNDEGW